MEMEKGHLSLPLACSLPRCPASIGVPVIPPALLTASCTWTQGSRGKAISQMLLLWVYGEPWKWAWRGSSCFPLTQCPEPSEGGLARQAGKSDQQLPVSAAETAAFAPVASGLIAQLFLCTTKQAATVIINTLKAAIRFAWQGDSEH